MLICISLKQSNFSERYSSIIFAGGDIGGSTVEVSFGDLTTKQLPDMRKVNSYSSMVLHNGEILLCGGQNNQEQCFRLENGTWMEHSILNLERQHHSAVATQSATFLFGGSTFCGHGFGLSTTYEYLPKESNA